MMAEGGAGGFDVGREFGFIERLFGGRVVLFWDDVVDGLFHLLLFFIYTSKNTTDLSKHLRLTFSLLISLNIILYFLNAGGNYFT